MRDDLGALAARYATNGRWARSRWCRGCGRIAGEDIDDGRSARTRARDDRAGKSTRDTARDLAALTGRPRRDVYKLITSARG